MEQRSKSPDDLVRMRQALRLFPRSACSLPYEPQTGVAQSNGVAMAKYVPTCLQTKTQPAHGRTCSSLSTLRRPSAPLEPSSSDPSACMHRNSA